jgi:hypothetical protein
MIKKRKWGTALAVGAMISLGWPGFAGPLAPERVAGDSKWILHLDGEALLQSQVGQYLADKLIEKEFAKFNADLQKNIGSELAWRHVKSLTMYGSEFKADGQANGILLIEGPVGLVEALDNLKAKQDANGASPMGDIQVIGSGADRIYIWKKEQYGMALGPDLFAVARSKDELARAKAVIAGKSPSLDAAAVASPGLDYTPIIRAISPKGLEGATLTGPVQMLQRCRKGQVALGEKEKDLALDLHVSANDAATANQLRDVVRGLISIGLLTGDKNSDATKLASGTTVDAKAQEVTLGIHLPVEDVIARIDESQKGGQAKKTDRPPKKKKKKNTDS